MPVGTPPPTAATASASTLNPSETGPGSVFTVAFDDRMYKTLFRGAVKVIGNIVSGATVGVLIGYAGRGNAGSTIGGVIGGAAGFVYGCVNTAREWSELQLEQVTDRRVRESERLARCAEHGAAADRLKALTSAADELKAAAEDHRQAVMSRYASGKNVDVERGNQRVVVLSRKALGLYRQALSLATDENIKRSLAARVESLEDHL